MEKEVERFIVYLRDVKKTTKNTEVSYARDLNKMIHYLGLVKISSFDAVTQEQLQIYVKELSDGGLSVATISRNIASMRAFFQYLEGVEKISRNPIKEMKAPKVEKKKPDVLTVDEVRRLIQQPKGIRPKEKRDKAMLKILYATGIRVSELLGLKLEQVNMEEGYLICKGEHRERVVPFENNAQKILVDYLNNSRSSLLGDKESDLLFVNCSGGAMSRQGFWKLLKKYGKDAGIEKEITPYTIRHSFATHLVENGTDIHLVSEMLGHADVSTTMVYLQERKEVYKQTHPEI